MRALCASIVTAGALMGLGLACVGLGIRYQGLGMQDPNHIIYVRFGSLDTPMMLSLVVLLIMVVIGIATVYVGLAYHHERRHHERLHWGKTDSLTSRIGE